MKSSLFNLLIFLIFSYNLVAQEKTMEESQKNGKIIYTNFCAVCHMADGKGVEKVFPPLANSDYLRENQEGSIRAIKYGMSGEIVVNGITYNSLMAPLGLSDEEVADVMTYINNAWGNKIDNKVTAEIVANIKK
jgi:mono/diheme cytochrome c family protein